MKRLIAPLALCILILAACSKEDPNFGIEILGTWELSEIWEDGARATRTDSTVAIFKATELVIKSWDSSYTETVLPYSIDDDNLYLDNDCFFIQKLDDTDLIYTKCAENVRYEYKKI